MSGFKSTPASPPSRQDSSTTLHDGSDIEACNAASIKSEKISRPALSRGDSGSTRVEPASSCPCTDAPRARSLSDIVEVGSACHHQCTVIADPSEKLEVTDEDRNKAPPFCDMQKVISSKGEQLIYVGWNGPEDPANPRNWSLKKKWIITSVSRVY